MSRLPKREQKKPLVVYNTTDKSIFIVTAWRRDLNGGPAIRETTYCIHPGEGIDLSILGLEPKKSD